MLHTDEQLMPPHARDWSPLNIVTQPEAEAASVTVWMNRIDSDLRSQLRRPLFQTWNPVIEPAKSHVIADFSFERPVVNAASVTAMAELQASQGHGHVWFVGAYSRYSMPLLENGVKSAMEVPRGPMHRASCLTGAPSPKPHASQVPHASRLAGSARSRSGRVRCRV